MMKDTMRSSCKNYLLELIDSIYGKSCSELGRTRLLWKRRKQNVVWTSGIRREWGPIKSIIIDMEVDLRKYVSPRKKNGGG